MKLFRNFLFVFLLAMANALHAQTGNQSKVVTDEEGLHQLSLQLTDRWKADSTKAVKIGLPLLVEQGRNTATFVGFNGNAPIYVMGSTLSEVQSYHGQDLWAGQYNLSGSGLYAGMWEAFDVSAALPNPADGNLQTAGSAPSRVFPQNAGTTSSHANNVAWRMAGDGAANATTGQGIAYQALIKAWDVTNGDAELAANAGSLLVSNHSYAQVRGWTPGISVTLGAVTKTVNWWSESNVNNSEDYGFGTYTSTDEVLDEISKLAPFHSIVKAAGNDRGQNGSTPVTTFYTPDGINYTFATYSSPVPEIDGGADGFDCLPSGAAAKNAFIIGACADIVGGYTVPADVVVMSFSSFGPTDDGRIKPDFVAPGPGGTSYSSPNVSGAIVLLQELYDRENGAYMQSATVKALLAQTAFEAGTNPGPDYKHGWGLINPKGAADVILDQTGSTKIIESNLANTETDYYYVYSDGVNPLTATICWIDPEATPLTRSFGSSDLNNAATMLVNDLDMRIINISGATVASPYTLNPALPGNAASTGDNFRDNIEKIVYTPIAGWYALKINHKGALATSQNYSLVVSGINNASCASTTPVAIDNTWNGITWSTAFVDGQNVLVTGNLNVPSSLVFGDAFFAEGVTVTIASGQNLSITGNVYAAKNVSFTGSGSVRTTGVAAQTWCGGCTANLFDQNNSSSLTLQADSLKIKEILTLNQGLLNSNGLLKFVATVGNYAQLAEAGGSIIGTATYEQVVSGVSGWRHVASPLATNLADLLEETTDFELLPTGGSVYRWDAPTGAWVNPANTTSAFGATNPYIVYFGTSGSRVYSNLPHKIALAGVLNSGAVNNSVAFGAATPISNNQQGWNLLANPYPQNLSWNSITANFGGLNLSISGSYYVWDANAGDFREHNGSIGDAQLGGNIAPGQAFFVRLLDLAAEATTAFDFTNANRTSVTADFLKTDVPYLNLFASQQGKTDHFYVALRPDKSNGLDADVDAFKLFSPEPGVPQLFQQNAFDDFGLAINYVSANAAHLALPLNYVNTLEGEVSIGLQHFELFEDWQILLEDKRDAVWFDLRKGNYVFAHAPQNLTNRFVLHLFKQDAGTVNTAEAGISAWGNSGNLNVVLSEPLANATLRVYNLQGQLVNQEKYQMLSQTQIPFVQHGVFLIEVTGENGKTLVAKWVN